MYENNFRVLLRVFLWIIRCTKKISFKKLYWLKALFDGSGTAAGEKTLEDKFFEHEVGGNWEICLMISFFTE